MWQSVTKDNNTVDINGLNNYKYYKEFVAITKQNIV